MIVLGIDPGAAGAGYAVWDSDAQRHIHVGTECPIMRVNFIVVESGFIGKMGRQSMWGLGFDAGWRMRDAKAGCWDDDGNSDPLCFTIRPDGVNGWRAALPPRPGCHQKFDGLPGDVIVARLRQRYRLHAPTPPGEYPHTEHALGPGHTEHEVEACGIAEAAAAILQRPKAKDRRALKAVKR